MKDSHEHDKEFLKGVWNTVNVCMNVQTHDRVHIITDQASLMIGKALKEASLTAAAKVHLVVLEQFGNRPFSNCPDELLDDIMQYKSTVTFFIAFGQEGEFKMRKDMWQRRLKEYSRLGLDLPRTAYMGSVTPQIMREGMLADYHQVYELTMRVFEIVKDARMIEASSNRGSHVLATFDPTLKWVPVHGLIHEMGMWGNLPDGEVFTSPASVEGSLVADVLGDCFQGTRQDPVTFRIKNSQVVEIRCDDKDLAFEIEKYLNSSQNGRKVGEFGIGTNTGVKELVGRNVQDEKIPGFHMAFGDPLGIHTGATWTSDVHLDVVPTGCTIQVDGKVIMEDGQFLI